MFVSQSRYNGKTTNYTLTSSDTVVRFYTGTNLTATLPTATGSKKQFTIKNDTSTGLTVTSVGGGSYVDGNLGVVSLVIPPGASIRVIDYATNNYSIMGGYTFLSGGTIVTGSGNITVAVENEVIKYTGTGSNTITIPALSILKYPNKKFFIKNSGSGSVTVAVSGGTIDGSASISLAAGAGIIAILVDVSAWISI